MGTLADSLFTVLMGWVRALVSAFWALFSSDDTTILEFLGRNWLIIAVVIIAAGLVIDWLIWLIRWRPYHLWAQRARRLLRIEEPEEEEEQALRARPAVTSRHVPVHMEEEPEEEPELFIDEADEQEAYARAQSVPDAALGAYPGMRYDRENPQADAAAGHTQRYSVLTEEGPGAAEVARRRDEIDAYRRMQEEAAQRAREEASRRAEEERMAREEASRRAEEERAAREEEQARLAQEQYARELAEYERQRAQYERDLAEYERQKAAYDARIAAQETTANEEAKPTRRRRASSVSYSDYAPQEDIGELPDAPAWPQMDEVHSDTLRMAAVKAPEENAQEKKSSLFDRMAQVIAPQEEDEIAGIRALPPRVDPRDAYKPAKKPDRDGRRRR